MIIKVLPTEKFCVFFKCVQFLNVDKIILFQLYHGNLQWELWKYLITFNV